MRLPKGTCSPLHTPSSTLQPQCHMPQQPSSTARRSSTQFQFGCTGGAGTLFVAQDDARDFFYRLSIPDDMKGLFGLPFCDYNELCAAFHRVGVAVPSEVHQLHSTGAPIRPAMAVLPMGFSWAFHLAHVCHTYQAERALPDTEVLEERRPVPEREANPKTRCRRGQALLR